MELQLTFPTTELQGAYPANAEKLFAILEVNSKFADWITRRISQYGFIENQDYVIQIAYTKGRPRKEYFITLDMAKELCMVENNERGKEARRYFIKCEKELQEMKFKEISARNLELTSQISRHNTQIATLKRELKKAQIADIFAGLDLSEAKFQPFSQHRPSYKELWFECINILGERNGLKVQNEALRAQNEKLISQNKRLLLILGNINAQTAQLAQI